MEDHGLWDLVPFSSPFWPLTTPAFLSTPLSLLRYIGTPIVVAEG